jgi:hypothetical protein
VVVGCGEDLQDEVARKTSIEMMQTSDRYLIAVGYMTDFPLLPTSEIALVCNREPPDAVSYRRGAAGGGMLLS